MPHFSKGTHTFEQIDTSKHYHLTGWVNMPTKWNDSKKRYEPRTVEQINAQNQIYELMKQSGAGIQVVVHERMDGLDKKDFPVKHRITLYVNNYDNYNANQAPAAPTTSRNDTGWG